MGPRGAFSLVTCTGCSRVSLGCVYPPVAVEPRLLPARYWVGVTLRVTEVRTMTMLDRLLRGG